MKLKFVMWRYLMTLMVFPLGVPVYILPNSYFYAAFIGEGHLLENIYESERLLDHIRYRISPPITPPRI